VISGFAKRRFVAQSAGQMPPLVPPILTQGLTKRFRQVTALEDMNLEVERGEVLALLGANGSGKTTTFRLLLNIYRPSAGQALLLGRSAVSLDGRDFDKVGYISEGQKMPRWMRVGDFLDYCGGFYRDWDEALGRSLLDRFGLTGREKIKHLSRGQAMKVAVASTLPSHPELLLLDEPFSGLDVETRAQLGELLKTLARQDGLAIILTTHDVEEVEPLATRLALLQQGRLVVDESLASFVGRHRLLAGEGLEWSTLPEALRARFTQGPSLLTESKIFTESFDPAMEAETVAALAHHSIAARLVPMSLRQILLARSWPVS
jgi:ABC-2 type transport system ATP-binding protein